MEQAKLNKILDEHKKWLRTNGKEGQRADLSSADLSSANLSFADLSYADLSSANLSSANLSFADLSYADLSSANLSSADLSFANLRSANLSSADLRSADLSYADLSSANLSYADLSSADLSSANLSSADLDYSAFPLWCGGLDVNIDDRQATQLLYHLIRNVNYSKNTSKSFKKICRIKSLVKQANKFHRVEECGIIMEDTEDDK